MNNTSHPIVERIVYGVGGIICSAALLGMGFAAYIGDTYAFQTDGKLVARDKYSLAELTKPDTIREIMKKNITFVNVN